MKKSVIAVLLALLMLISIGCGKEENKDETANPDTLGQFFDDHEKYIADGEDPEVTVDIGDEEEKEDFSFIEGIPEGWATRHEGNVYLSYPDDIFTVSESFGADFLVMESTNGSNINIIVGAGDTLNIYDIGNEHIDAILDMAMPTLESTYETALNAECESEKFIRGTEVKTFGNQECVCLSYSVKIIAPELDVEIPIDYYQVMYIDNDKTTTVTFTYFTDDGTGTAEEYFADIIDLLYFE